MPFDKQILEELAISESEYQMILDKLDREPNK